MFTNEPVLIITHIPKTGGTSLKYHFQKYLRNNIEFFHYSDKGNKLTIREDAVPFDMLNDNQLNDIKVVLGHNVNHDTKTKFNRPFEEMVVFRKPEDWVISRYNQNMNFRYRNNQPLTSFKQWACEIEQIHCQFEWFLIHYLKMGLNILSDAREKKLASIINVLDSFKYVFFLDEFDIWSKRICIKLNIPNEIESRRVRGLHKRNHYQPQHNDEELIQNLCELDRYIYNEIYKRYHAR